MSRKPIRPDVSTVKRDDELWTQEEVMEYGLGGEEEYCDIQIIEADVPFAIEEMAVVEDMAAVEETTAYGESAAFEETAVSQTGNVFVPEPISSASSRVRKKSAKWIAMEESDRLEKVFSNPDRKTVKGNSRKSRNSLSDYTIDETLGNSSTEVNPSLNEEKPIKVRFSLGSNLDAQNSAGKTTRKPKKVDDEASLDSNIIFSRNVVIDKQPSESQVQGRDVPLRMKLTLSSKSGPVDENCSTEQLHSSPKKSRKNSKRSSDPSVSASSENSVPVDALGTKLTVKQVAPRHISKPSFGGNDDVELEDHTDQMIPIVKRAYGIKKTEKLKDATKTKKKQRMKGYTAYMVWCSSQREKLIAQNPGIDFSTVSKILGDTWHTVPEKEKMAYRRKARKLSKKGVGLISTGKPKEAIGTVSGRTGRPVGRPPLHGNYRRSLNDDDNCVRAVGTSPIDCAAHLKLLGESLTTIGSRLQEHRGKIAVQGSLSVLFDSLLCVLGTLMCMTKQVPELNGCPEEIHARTLSNIAYIMPGVG